MKNYKLVTLTGLMLFTFFACDERTEPAKAENNAEVLTDNILIRGAIKISGEMPVPNNGVFLFLENVNESAFLDAGFEIPISTNADVTGAYIRFIDANNNAANSYYDVDLEANEGTGKSAIFNTFRFLKKSGNTKTAKGTEFTLNASFKPEFSLGNFCYEICVYDDQGNISNPQTICVTVNEWGGNNDLVGLWNLIYAEDLYEGELSTETVGIEDCSFNTCFLIEYQTITFNEAGTYNFKGKTSRRDEDTGANVRFQEYESSGNWFYDPAKQELTIAEYYFKDVDETGQVNIEEIPLIDAELFLVNTVITGNQLKIITDAVDLDGDGIIDESYTEFYER